jgi:hypothetical protein
MSENAQVNPKWTGKVSGPRVRWRFTPAGQSRTELLSAFLLSLGQSRRGVFLFRINILHQDKPAPIPHASPARGGNDDDHHPRRSGRDHRPRSASPCAPCQAPRNYCGDHPAPSESRLGFGGRGEGRPIQPRALAAAVGVPLPPPHTGAAGHCVQRYGASDFGAFLNGPSAVEIPRLRPDHPQEVLGGEVRQEAGGVDEPLAKAGTVD